jgi:hypothetical protein
LLALWDGAAEIDPTMVRRNQRTKARAPVLAQRALNALTSSAFFAGIAEHALIFDLKQVRSYFDDAFLREQIQSRVSAVVTADTSVLIGHFLGSVVAYEALFANHNWNVDTFVSLGSPLGIRNLIYDRLQPPPSGGVGRRPDVARWVNVADRGDVVALAKALAPDSGAWSTIVSCTTARRRTTSLLT